MSAYIISDVTIKDGAAIDIYRQRAAASIAQHGGRYVVRGGEIEVLEGSWRPRAIIIAEFPDMERARTWYRSAEYASALALRDEALSRKRRSAALSVSRDGPLERYAFCQTIRQDFLTPP